MSSPTAVPSASSAASPSQLLVVYAEHDLVEAALSGEGQGVNKPVVRKRNILDALQAEAKAREEKDPQATQAVRFEALKEPAASLAPAALVHEPGMLDLFATGWARWEALGDNRDLYFTPAGRVQPADWSELIPSASTCRDALQRAPKESIHAQVNYYAQCRTTPITKHTSALLHNDLAVTLRAVEAVKNGEAREVYACTTQPGHHSSYTSYGGYCYINQAALCAALLSEHFRAAQGSSGKVAFIDVDYHAGNGSMSIFYERDDVFFASIHADPLISYPYTSNFQDQTGADAGEGCTMNVCLGKDTTWTEYRPALAKVLAAVQAFGARALVVSLGVDTLAGDPEAAPLGGFAIQQQDYDEMGRMVREIGLPTIWVQEGGYKLDEAGDVVRHVLLGPTVEEEAARSKQ